MMKSLSPCTRFLLSASLISALHVGGCATGSPEDFADLNCQSLQALIERQDYAASIRGVEFISDRSQTEIRQTSGSPWAGRTRTQDEQKLRDERRAISHAYRRKACKS